MPSELNTAHASAPAATPIAARLCKARTIARPPARTMHPAVGHLPIEDQAMRSDGLRIEGPTALHVARVSATDDPGEVGVVDVVMLVIRETTPIQPEDASQPGYRDTLVVTLRSGGFQGPGAG